MPLPMVRTWLLDRLIRSTLGTATGLTTWVEDVRGDDGVLRVKVERDWKREEER